MTTQPTAPRRVLTISRILLPVLLVVLAIEGYRVYLDWQVLRASRTEITLLGRVLRASELALSSLKDLEAGELGYLLTGRPDYRRMYERAKAELPALVDSIGYVVITEDQKQRVGRLRVLVGGKLSEIDATLAKYDQSGGTAALHLHRELRGEATMDALRDLCNAIREAAYDRQRTISEELESRSEQSRIAIFLGGAIFTGLLAFAVVLAKGALARRAALAAILESARREFQVTLASIGDGVITTDANGVVTFLNPVAGKLTGWNPSDAEGQPVESVFPLVLELTDERVENPATQVLLERRVINMDYRTNLIRRDGTVIPVDDSAAPILDSAGRLAGVVMVFRDISIRRASEETLRRWEHVFRHAGFGMMILSPGAELRMDHVNPAFASMHGYTVDELIGRSYLTVVSPEFRPAKAKMLNGTSEVDHLVTETEHVRKDGSIFPVLADFTLVRNDLGKLLYCTGYCSDISDRKRSEEELRRSEARYRSTADSLPQLVWSSRPDGTTEYLNKRWHEATGLTLEQAGDQGWTYYLHAEDREDCLSKWSHALNSGETFQAECRFKTPRDQEPRWYSCRAVAVRDGDGRILQWFGSCTDIHEQKLAADALRASKVELQLANEALQRSNTDLEQFAFAASHDLQEPLRMVAIYSQLLKREFGDKLNEQANTYLNFAVDGALRMEALLKDLLTYSRAARTTEASRGPISSEAALQKALANLTALIRETGAEVIRTALPAVRIPEVHLVQVFQNLIGNAIKYRKPRERAIVEVSAILQDGNWVFSVKDNGIGVNPEYHNQIFRIFGRLHGQDVPGTGIGLALCKKIVERAGGSIWVDSALGKGSTFYFTIRA